MTDTSPITQDPKTGRLLPGNIWKAPPWRPGHSGHTARFTPGRIVTVCTEYIEQQITNTEPITWAGLAWYMGLSRRGLDKYSKGEIGKDKPGIVHSLDLMKTYMEGELESKLTNREHATSGVIKALQAIDREKWGDNQKVEIDIKQQISIAIDPDSALGKRLNKAGVGSGITIDQSPEGLE